MALLPTTNGVAGRMLVQLANRWGAVSAADLLKAAEAGDAGAQYFLGLSGWHNAFLRDPTVPARPVADPGRPLGPSQSDWKAYEAQWGAVADEELRRAAQSGERSAMWFLYAREARRATAISVEKARKAFEWLKKSAENAFAPAQYELAIRYLGQKGSVIGRDSRAGLDWLQRAADQDWEPARHFMADLCLAGDLVPLDLPKAVECLRSAAAQDCSRAQYELGCHYANGNSEPRSEKETPVALFRAAARSGYGPALHELGDRFRTGLGVPQDYIRAIRCYQAARDSGALPGLYGAHSSSSPFLGGSKMIRSAFDLVEANLAPAYPLSRDYWDFAETLSTYLKATRLKEPSAQYAIASLYLTGRFVPKSAPDAYRWLSLAAAKGSSVATQELDRLRPTLTPEQIEQAAKPLPAGPDLEF